MASMKRKKLPLDSVEAYSCICIMAACSCSCTCSCDVGAASTKNFSEAFNSQANDIAMQVSRAEIMQ